jgi:2-keto-4-pentenoate hydratase/2-oxohepta-3-ene-1,7-dioic acid hydratase in catechol pathway
MHYSLGTLLVDGQATPVVRTEQGHWALDSVLPEAASAGWMEVLQSWDRLEGELSKRVAAVLSPQARLPDPSLDQVLAPLLYPGKVCCTGANYREHVSEVGLSEGFDKSRVRPSFFLKPPRTAVVGSGRSVRYPRQTKQFDWEIELAVVIGRKARHVEPGEAMAHVAGYMVGLDLSARDYLLHPGNMAGFDTFGGKGFDCSCPLGPFMVPARFVRNPQDLPLSLSVNGEMMQKGNTSDMVWTVAEQIAEMSAVMTLEPGDVLLTGTPPGSGLSRGRFLQVGDKVVADIGGVGRLELEIVPDAWHERQVPCPLIPAATASKEHP